MKKATSLLSLMIVIATISCTDRTSKKEVIVVPAASAPAPSPIIIVKEPAPTKPTSISVDRNGVKVETKKIDVKVNN